MEKGLTNRELVIKIIELCEHIEFELSLEGLELPARVHNKLEDIGCYLEDIAEIIAEELK